MKYYYLDVTIKDDIAYVLLNNVEEQNRIQVDFAQELLYVAREFVEKNEAKMIVLGATGDHFCKGLVESNVNDSDISKAVSIISNAIEEWARIPHPIIAGIQGECNSLGLSLACIADIRFATSDTTFTIPEVSKGLLPTGGITQRLPRLIGKGPAMGMLLGGDAVNGNEALELGLVNQIHPDYSLWKKTCEYAQELVEMSTLSMQYTKESLLRGSELPLEQALRFEVDLYMLLQTGSDRMEGIQAFLEKRPANFSGK